MHPTCERVFPSLGPCSFGDCVMDADKNESVCVCWPGFSSKQEFLWPVEAGTARGCTANMALLLGLYRALLGLTIVATVLYSTVIALKIRSNVGSVSRMLLRKVPTCATLLTTAVLLLRRLQDTGDGEYVIGRDFVASLFLFLTTVMMYSSGIVLVMKYHAYSLKSYQNLKAKVRGSSRMNNVPFKLGVLLFITAASGFAPVIGSIHRELEFVGLRLMLVGGFTTSFAFCYFVQLVYAPNIRDLELFLTLTKELGKEKSQDYLRVQAALKASLRERRMLILSNVIIGLCDIVSANIPLMFNLYRYFVPMRISLGIVNISLSSVHLILRLVRQGALKNRRKSNTNKINPR